MLALSTDKLGRLRHVFSNEPIIEMAKSGQYLLDEYIKLERKAHRDRVMCISLSSKLRAVHEWLICADFDFSNGNVDPTGVYDEGTVRGRAILDELIYEIAAVLEEYDHGDNSED